jgi:hypothetical protein
MGITFTSEEIKEIKGRIETQGQGKLGSGVIPVVVWW